MQIPEKFKQFQDTATLMVVTGKQNAVFYLAANGEINKVESFRVEKPEYTDVEGHFESSGDYGTYRAGSPYDPTDKDEKATNDFLKELGEELESVSRHRAIDWLVVFTPEHMKNKVHDLLPDVLTRRTYTLLTGNHYDDHPTELLEKLKNETRTDPVKPMKEAARKILNKFRKS